MKINIGKLIIIVVWVLVTIAGGIIIYVLRTQDDAKNTPVAESSLAEEVLFPVEEEIDSAEPSAELTVESSAETLQGIRSLAEEKEGKEFKYVISERKKSSTTTLHVDFGSNPGTTTGLLIVRINGKQSLDAVVTSNTLGSMGSHTEGSTVSPRGHYSYDVDLPNGDYTVTWQYQVPATSTKGSPSVRIENTPLGGPKVRVTGVPVTVPTTRTVSKSRTISLKGGKVWAFLNEQDMKTYQVRKALEDVNAETQKRGIPSGGVN